MHFHGLSCSCLIRTPAREGGGGGLAYLPQLSQTVSDRSRDNTGFPLQNVSP